MKNPYKKTIYRMVEYYKEPLNTMPQSNPKESSGDVTMKI